MLTDVDRFPSITIGDHVFYVRRMEPFVALRVLGELQKHILGPASAALDQGKPSSLADALSAVSDKLDGATLERLAKLLLSPTYVSVARDGADPRRLDDGQVNLTLSSAGDLLILAAFVAKVNYEDFLGKFMGQVASAMPSLSGMGSASPLN